MDYEKIIETALNETIEEFKNENPKIFTFFHFGEVEIDTKNLAIWFLYKTDLELKESENNGLKNKIRNSLNRNFHKFGYPEKSITKIFIGFTSDEEIQKTTSGNYWEYFR